ncbi:atp-dependent helicase [Methylobacterium phyllostachyos]|uniref:atp-dependent helicase n=1 Tax=Methylobacterium phyllostachyos TaxID=582672 RepID=UPI001FCD052E|nr:atp-dependent helicase [Methylobacterium phyllostachyos]
MTVTGDETLRQESIDILRQTQAKLEEAQAEAASLRVLLAIRTHQHSQAWRARQLCAAELEAVRSAAAARTVPREADQASTEAIARAEARTDAVQTVLGAVLASLRFWALDRRRFQALIVQASRATPDEGSAAERHAVLLAETRRVLGRTE